jgi:endonuclease YncB( thermonuclease family)
MARIVLIALLAVLLATPVAASRVHSFAFVRSDGSLDIKGRNYRLYGIHIPQTGRSCGRTLRPARCGSRAALALDLKIQRISRNRDRSLNAVCWAGEVDLAAYLLNQGWALALPGAPFSYVALERIAQSRGRGLWGFQADSIIIPNRRR